MKILISGAGIAGLTSAYWLQKYGFQVTIIEKAPKIRDEGYMIDFYAEGLQIARAMGIGKILEQKSGQLKQVNFVNRDDSVQGGFTISNIQKIIQKDGGIAYLPLMRGDLEHALFGSLRKDSDIRFNESICEITQNDNQVDVVLSSGKKESFDLVIGADGIHSNTRKLVFGDEASYIVPTGHHIAIARVPGDEATSNVSTHVEKDYFVMGVPTQDSDTIGVFGFTSPDKIPARDKQAEFIKNTFTNTSSLAKSICSKIKTSDRIFFDEVAQVHMEKWTAGRVALIGDAAACPTLLSGQGAIMAMTEAYVLAHQLSIAKGNYTQAFEGYESILMPVLKEKMENARKISGTIIPSSKLKKNVFYFMVRFMKYDFFLKAMFQGFLKPTLFDTHTYSLDKS